MLRTLVTACFLGLCSLGVALPLCARTAAEGSLRARTFVVDAGHGTRAPDGAWLNGGAVGPDGIEEQAVALATAEDLATLLRAAGAAVVLTRSYRSPYRIATDKRRDNRARAALANRMRATAFIALHADSSLSSTAHGTSVFWLRSNSVPLANAVRERLAPLGLGEAAFHARDLAVTSEARVPAVLVELGFVSNRLQERLLATPGFRHREARALFDALEDVFGR